MIMCDFSIATWLVILMPIRLCFIKNFENSRALLIRYTLTSALRMYLFHGTHSSSFSTVSFWLNVSMHIYKTSHEFWLEVLQKLITTSNLIQKFCKRTLVVKIINFRNVMFVLFDSLLVIPGFYFSFTSFALYIYIWSLICCIVVLNLIIRSRTLLVFDLLVLCLFVRDKEFKISTAIYDCE